MGSPTVTQVKESKRENTSTISFPNTLGKHKTILTFKDYSYSGLNDGDNPFASFIYRGTIELPLPEKLSDSFSLGVTGDELGALASGISEATSGVVGGTAGSLIQNLLNTSRSAGTSAGGLLKSVSGDDKTQQAADIQKAISGIGDASQFFLRSALAGISPDLAKGIGVAQGKALNPFATLVYSGVSLKTHELSWKLSPENERESDMLRDIIRLIKANSLPNYVNPLGGNPEGELSGINTLDRGLLEYPSFVDISFDGIEEEYFYKIKKSMISSLSIDYVPDGKAILRGGKPSAVMLSMSIVESTIHTADEYGKRRVPSEFGDIEEGFNQGRNLDDLDGSVA